MPGRRRSARTLGCLGAAFVVAAAGGLGAGLYASRRGWIEPLPVEARCVVTGSTGSVTLTLDQARYASIIAGRSVALGLKPRAATIALATAYQESGIRNLDHGDRDSLGLFQQRPSKGWGTADQVRDPWYAADAFYAALVKVPGWETADINDTAQAVQRSGVPQGYRKHEPKARILAEVFTGHGDAGVTCLRHCVDCSAGPGAEEFLADARRTLGSVTVRRDATSLTLVPHDAVEAWRLAAYAVVNGPTYSLDRVQVGTRTWRARLAWPAGWSGGDSTGDVVVGTY